MLAAVQHLKRFGDLYASNHLKSFNGLSNSVVDIRFTLCVLTHSYYGVMLIKARHAINDSRCVSVNAVSCAMSVVGDKGGREEL